MNKRQWIDYGVISSENDYYTKTIHKPIDATQNKQIKNLTYKGEGLSFSFIDKAFISFTYGGRKIEDFNLIAISINNRFDRETPPGHEDYITEYKMLDGQYYWSSHYNARELVLMLATDGILQEQLDDFKNWFSAGSIRLLILSLHPNRGILARISQAPEISLLPFKKCKTVIINLLEIEVTVILYKGNIRLDLVMDLPFWYAINNVFGEIILDEYGYRRFVNKQIDCNGNVIHNLDADGYKTVVEDKIPTSEMIDDDINLSDGVRLIPYNKYKYTLTTDMILAKDENNNLIAGTPVVNETINYGSRVDEALVDVSKVDAREYLSDDYPFSGAIAGPIYIKTYEEDEVITEILDSWVHQKCIILSNEGTIIPRDEENFYTVFRSLPVKKDSTIQYDRKFYESLVAIVLYDANTKLYINMVQLRRQASEHNNINIKWTADKDYYIRMYTQISADEKKYFNNFNDIVHINLLTFKEGQEALSVNLSYIDTIEKDWIIDDYLIDTNNPKDGYYITGISEYSDLFVLSVIKYLEAGKNSTIINKGAKQLVLFLYSKKDRSLMDIIFNVHDYIFTLLYYVRLYVIGDKLNYSSNLNINDYIEIKLFSFQIGSISSSFNYFYSGTAPSYPQINFSIPIHFNLKGYIDTFNNEYILSDTGLPYNTLCLESNFKHELKLTIPSIFSAYNNAIDILRDPEMLNNDITSLIQNLRLAVNHQVVRNWVIGCINIYINTFNSQENIDYDEYLTKFTEDMRTAILLYMPYLFTEIDDLTLEEREGEPPVAVIQKDITVDYDYEHSNIDKYYHQMDAKVGKGFSINLITTNVKFYQWQYSPDNGKNWYLLLLDDKWIGTTTDTLQCNENVGGLNEIEVKYWYRCLVSNNTTFAYTEPVKSVSEEESIAFSIYAYSGNTNYDTCIGRISYVRIMATGFNLDTITIIYRENDEAAWKEINFNDLQDFWHTLASNSHLVIENRLIYFYFTPINLALSGYEIDIKIQSKFDPNVFLRLSDKKTNNKGYILTIYGISSIEFNAKTSTSQTGPYTILSDYDNFVVNLGKFICFLTCPVFNQNNSPYKAAVVYLILINDLEWVPISSNSSYFSNISIFSSQNITTLRFMANINDNNKQIRARIYYTNAGSSNNTAYYYPNEEGFRINRIVGPNSSDTYIDDPIYPFAQKIVYVGDDLTIRPIDPNINTKYQWYYKANEDDENEILLLGQTNQELILTEITENNSGYYRIKIYNDNDIENINKEYINIIVAKRIIINSDLPEIINIECYEEELNNNYILDLVINTLNVKYYTWYMEVPNENLQKLTGSLLENENEQIISCSINRKYNFFKNNNVIIWCECTNGIDSTRSRYTQIKFNIKHLEYFNFSLVNNSTTNNNWNWSWPLNTRSVVVPCSWNIDKTTNVVSFIGTPNLKNRVSFMRVGKIIILPNNANYYWNKIELDLTSYIINYNGIDGSNDFGIDIRLDYYKRTNDTTLTYFLSKEFDYDDFKTNLHLGTIFDKNDASVNEAEEIRIFVKPYYNRTSWQNIYSETIYTHYLEYPITDVINMTGSELGFIFKGEKITKRSLRLLSKGKNNIQEYIPLKRPIAEIKYYMPGTTVSNDELLTSAEIINLDKFIAAVNNNGIDKIYCFTFLKINNEGELSYGFRYNSSIFYTLDSLEEQLGIAITYNTIPIPVIIWDEDTLTYTEVDNLFLYYPNIVEGMVLEVKLSYPEAINFNLKQNLIVNINCATGENNISYKYNKIKWGNSILENLTDPKLICYLSSLRDKQTYTMVLNAGDMIFYNNFIFSEQNHFDNLTGRIKPWKLSDKTLCHKLTYDGKIPIRQLRIYYKNYYL